MKIYGFTIVDTDYIDGEDYGKESKTSIFLSMAERNKSAWEEYSASFDGEEFPDGVDDNGEFKEKKADFIKAMNNNGYVWYQRFDSHRQFEAFEREI